ncbi:Rrf2 family transcriptional regulator [bacterium]|nr:Rrf2 family transcriptional regulator [bacterium]
MVQTLLKISEAASLALHTVEQLAREKDRFVPTQEIAEALHVSEHHLAKVHQRLARAGLVRSTRGPGGGFQLDRAPAKITLREVYEAVEGPVEPHRCLLGRAECRRIDCLLGGLADRVNREVLDFFEHTTVADLAR